MTTGLLNDAQVATAGGQKLRTILRDQHIFFEMDRAFFRTLDTGKDV